jgi:PPOX class probable F420-dependent enzyme
MDAARGLALISEYGAAERWLAVLVTLRDDGQPSVSVVNVGMLPHPVDGRAVVAFVERGDTAKLANLRRYPVATLIFRSGWDWIAVRGPVSLVGPQDPLPGVSHEECRQLLRDIYHAAGRSHPDMTQYDEVMASEPRTAVLLRPQRFTTNPPGTDHEEN